MSQFATIETHVTFDNCFQYIVRFHDDDTNEYCEQHVISKCKHDDVYHFTSYEYACEMINEIKTIMSRIRQQKSHDYMQSQIKKRVRVVIEKYNDDYNNTNDVTRIDTFDVVDNENDLNNTQIAMRIMQLCAMHFDIE